MALVLASIATAGAARANGAAVKLTTSRGTSPGIASQTNLQVESERLTFRCGTERGIDLCAFEARYAIRNPEKAREEVAVAFYGHRLQGVSVYLDGEPLFFRRRSREHWDTDEFHEGAPSNNELSAIDDMMDQLPGSPCSAEDRYNCQWRDQERVGFIFASEPLEGHELVVTGNILGVPVREEYADLGLLAAPWSYHPLASTWRPDLGVLIEYLLSPIRTWKGKPKIDVRIVYPSSWKVQTRLFHYGRRDQPTPRVERVRQGWTVIDHFTLAHDEADSLYLHMDVPPSRVAGGGPLFAVGSTYGAKNTARGRVGYEFSSYSWLFFSANADTDFRRRFILAPLVKASTLVLLESFPNVGIGLGVPVQIAPDPRAGIRIQADVCLLEFLNDWLRARTHERTGSPLAPSFVTSVDVYPRAGVRSTLAEVSLLGQLSM